MRWLDNFNADELQYAVLLLNGFIYYSDPLVDAMFKAAFQSLNQFLLRPDDSFNSQQSAWRSFVDSILLTYVTGEEPSPADSGFSFARKARDVLGVREDQILPPDETVRFIMAHGVRPVVFVDDFVGSGNQFIDTWRRPVSLDANTQYSFERLSSLRGSQFYYCPTLCTQVGYDWIKSIAPKVLVNPAHVLTEDYSALTPNSRIWPEHIRAKGISFLHDVARRSQMPDTNGSDVDDWQGFHRLGLAVAFSHSVPDATLPIFHWDKNGWIPLIRKARQG